MNFCQDNAHIAHVAHVLGVWGGFCLFSQVRKQNKWGWGLYNVRNVRNVHGKHAHYLIYLINLIKKRLKVNDMTVCDDIYFASESFGKCKVILSGLCARCVNVVCMYMCAMCANDGKRSVKGKFEKRSNSKDIGGMMRTIGFANGKFYETQQVSFFQPAPPAIGDETTPQAGDIIWPMAARYKGKIQTALRKHGLDLDENRVI